MSFKEVTGSRQYKAWKEWGEGEYIIGKYVDQGEQDGDYGIQQWYDIELTESNFGADLNRTFRLNGVGSLDSKMEMIDVGSEVKVIYVEYGTLDKGKFAGKPFHDIKVMVSEKETPNTLTNSEKSEEVDYAGL